MTAPQQKPKTIVLVTYRCVQNGKLVEQVTVPHGEFEDQRLTLTIEQAPEVGWQRLNQETGEWEPQAEDPESAPERPQDPAPDEVDEVDEVDNDEDHEPMDVEDTGETDAELDAPDPEKEV